MHGSWSPSKLGALVAVAAAVVILLVVSGSGSAAPVSHHPTSPPGKSSKADTACNQATVSYDKGYACISVISDPEQLLCMSSMGKTGTSGYVRMEPCNRHSPDQEWGAFTVPGVYGAELWNVGESCPHHGLYGGLIHCATPFGSTSAEKGHGFCLRVLTSKAYNGERLVMSQCASGSNASQSAKNKSLGWGVGTTNIKGYRNVAAACSYVNGCPGPLAQKFWFSSGTDTRNATVQIDSVKHTLGIEDAFYGQVLHWTGSGTGLGCTKPDSKGC